MVTRITGMASGMDIDSIVKNMLKADSVKIDRVKQNKQKLQWKQQLYNDLNKDFANFLINARKEFGLMKTTLTGANINTGLSGVGWHKKATSSDEAVATATVSGIGAATGTTHTLEVKTLATGVNAESTQDMSAWKASGNFSIKINDTEVKIFDGDDIAKVASRINITRDANEMSIGVKANYDSTTGKFSLQTDPNSTKNKIEFQNLSDQAETLVNGLQLAISGGDNDGKVFGTGAGQVSIAKGTDGEVVYNGETKVVTSNTFAFNGIEFTAKTLGTTTVKVEADVDVAMEKIKKFVDEYNKMLDKASGLLKEKTNRNYQPLTEEQKEAMTEKEVELWEERAKKGLLGRDETIGNILSNVRSSLYEKVEGTLGGFNFIADIGITTEKYSSGSTGGRLAINETRLKNALIDDADSVMSVLFNESSSVSLTTKESELSVADLAKKRSESGIFTRITDEMVAGMKGIIDRSGTGDSSDLFRTIKSNMLSDFVTGTNNLSKKGSVSYIDDNLLKIEKEINSLNSWLFSRENAYYARFTAMEKAMQNMASQSGWLGQQMGM